MSRPNASFALLTCLALTTTQSRGQETTPPPASERRPAQAPPVFEVGTAAVALDVIVRDKKGRLVKDLTVSDFEVYEDGERQTIESFSVIARGAEALPGPGEAEEAEPLALPSQQGPALEPALPEETPGEMPSVVAFVFDRMSAEGRNVAHEAAKTYLTTRRSGDVVGVFAVDLALHTVQGFTDDAQLIANALDDASTQAGETRRSSLDQMDALQELRTRAAAAETAAAGAGPGDQAGMTLVGGAAVEATMAEMTMRMTRNFETLERDQQGFASTNSLLAVVQGMRLLPGRKTLVFFSEGMAIPPAVQTQFQSVIHEANRANVAIYAMDAAGLRVHSPTKETRDVLNAQARERFAALGREDNLGMLTQRAELNEDMLRQNPHSGLGALATQTGGFLIRDTNDARAGFRRIAQDMRFHYVLGYSPTNANYDGLFRNVSVKVKRSGMEVNSRRGYYAVKPGGAGPIRTYEAPVIALLDKGGPHPHAIPLHSTALAFPGRNGSAKTSVLVQVPGTAVNFVPDPGDSTSVLADLAIVVRVRNEYSQEVNRVSQHYELATAKDKLEAARSGNILFYREVDLIPGHYTLDAVAYDNTNQAATIRSVPLEVPPQSAEGPVISSLVLIGRVEQVPAAERDPENPFYYGEMLIYPNLGEPYPKSTTPALGFYVTGRGLGSGKKALVEVLREGQSVGQIHTDLPPPNPEGGVQHAGALPLASFAPGDYTLRLSVLEGGRPTMARTASFSVTE
jgi:VWFA-related protein